MRPDLVAVFLAEALVTVAVYGSLLAGGMLLFGRRGYVPSRWRLDLLAVVLIGAGLVGLALWQT